MNRDVSQIWNQCLRAIKAEINTRSFNTWFKPIKPVSLVGNELTIQVPNPFFYEYIEEHFVEILKRVLKEVLGPQSKLNYQIHRPVVGSSARHETQTGSEFIPGTYKSSDIKNPFVIPGIKKTAVENYLIEKYTFANFVEGDCNKLARAAGVAIAGNPGKTSFNPLVIYGGVGLGKTHLAHAIGNAIAQAFPNLSIMYVTSDKFTNQIIQSIKNRATEMLVEFYQSLDVLIVDDIQFLAGRAKTQEIFFHIFNNIHINGGQVILTSDKAPKDLEGLEERLISRFKWGLTADLTKPEFETRMAILDNKLEQHKLRIPMDAMEYICYNIKDNIRELEGIVISILAQTSLSGKTISLGLVRKAVSQYIVNRHKEITLEGIIEIVSEHYGISMDKILSRSRKRDIVSARQLAMYLAKKMTKNSLKVIGEEFGGKDHTTVLYACRAIDNLIHTDRQFRDELVALEKKVEMSLT